MEAESCDSGCNRQDHHEYDFQDQKTDENKIEVIWKLLIKLGKGLLEYARWYTEVKFALSNDLLKLALVLEGTSEHSDYLRLNYEVKEGEESKEAWDENGNIAVELMRVLRVSVEKIGE